MRYQRCECGELYPIKATSWKDVITCPKCGAPTTAGWGLTEQEKEQAMGKEPQASRESKKFLSAYPQEAKRIEGALPGCDCKSVQSLVADLRASMTEEEQAIGAYEFRGRQAKNDPLVAGVYHHIAPEERQHLAELKNQEMRLMDKVRACNCPLPGKGRTAFSGGKGGVSWGH